MKTVPNPRLDNLPTPLSAFIGREREIAEVKQLLAAHRLVTLTGPGGSGKTRLALRVASEMQGDYEDGVWLAELASLSDGALVTQNIASHLNVREQLGRPLIDTLADHLFSRHILLVIDNCEHLINACAQFAETILQRCPNLRILATSREILGIAGESVLVIPPLTLPEVQPWKSPASAQNALSAYRRSEAVQLFVNRATSIVQDFVLNTENAAWVSEICRRLDGMPLAIELAAARVRTLSVQQIAQRLDDRFHLLVGGSRTAEARQQTLAATLDWSYALLSEPERKVLQRFSTFSGGGTLEAAEAVCAGEGVASEQVLDILSHLIEKSLVVAERPEGGGRRYRLLETIRQYAREKLGESGEVNESKNRHLDFFLRLAEEAEPKLERAEQIAQLDTLEREHDNLRAALAWALESQVEMSEPTDLESGMRLAGALTSFWFKHSHWSEGRNWLRQVLAEGIDAPPSVKAKALFGAGILASFQNDSELALTSYEQSLTLYREKGDKQGIANALIWTAQQLEDLGEYVRAAALSEEGLNLHRQIGNKTGVATALHNLGELAYVQSEYRRATQFLEEGLALFRELGDTWGIGLELRYLSFVALDLVDPERAGACAGESLALYRELGDRRQIGSSLYALALANHAKGDNEAAHALLAEALPLLYELKDKMLVARCLEACGGIAVMNGKYERAALVFGTAEALRQTINAPVLLQRAAYERNVATVRARLAQVTLEKMWEEGRGLTLEQAIDYALAEPEPAEIEVSLKEKFGGLTEREREVAALIAQGKSNREIAKAMTVGVKTIETYVTRILNKLGFDSRVQIATWTIDKGLDRKESQ